MSSKTWYGAAACCCIWITAGSALAWPDRTHWPTAEQIKRDAVPAVFEPSAAPASVRVTGKLAGAQGTIDRLEWVHSEAASARRMETDAALVAFDARGRELSRARITSGGETYEGQLRASPQIERIELQLNGKALASRSAPRIELTGPEPGAALSSDQASRVAWRGSDPDGDTLLYLIERSWDGGQTWKVAGVTRYQRLFYWDWLKIGDWTIRVTVSDGFFARAAQTGTFEVYSARHEVGPKGVATPLPAQSSVEPGRPRAPPYTEIAETPGAPRTGWIISSYPEGAKVTVDGRALPGVTPMRIESVAPVMHVLTVELSGRSKRTELALSAVSGRMLRVPLIRLAMLPDDEIAKEHRKNVPWVPYTRLLVDAAIDAGADHSVCKHGLPFLYTIDSKIFGAGQAGELDNPRDVELFSNVITEHGWYDCLGELETRAQPPDEAHREPQLREALAAGDVKRCGNDQGGGGGCGLGIPRWPQGCVYNYAAIRGEAEACFAPLLGKGEDELHDMARCAYDIQSLRRRFDPALCARMQPNRYKALCMYRAKANTPEKDHAAACAKAFSDKAVFVRMCENGPSPLPIPIN